MKSEVIYLVSILMIYSSTVFSHGGATTRSGPLKGCHNDNSLGNYHCHTNPVSSMNLHVFPSKLDALVVATEEIPSTYKRSYFKHWTDDDGNCLNTRHETLKNLSLIDVKIEGCKVIEGKWNDFYFDEVIYKASLIDIDHIVPLKNAWTSGAHRWSPKEREAFANDPENLVVTNLKYNRKKGAKSPLEWTPLQRDYSCKYLKRWISLKERYSLEINPKIFADYERMSCDNI